MCRTVEPRGARGRCEGGGLRSPTEKERGGGGEDAPPQAGGTAPPSPGRHLRPECPPKSGGNLQQVPRAGLEANAPAPDSMHRLEIFGCTQPQIHRPRNAGQIHRWGMGSTDPALNALVPG
ncbi:hypothetical protein chiPu_0029518 [Chiloscyllium punctatum]|uniref:Uncharacterized protein n=1 Tax=Chiloscyllium punctatum TaxID=137246 RepID=A0A401TQZ5_CHIPU|nr:hypothetical protein [Chiloscyllium punctatum]